jgi:hypothetical protein
MKKIEDGVAARKADEKEAAAVADASRRQAGVAAAENEDKDRSWTKAKSTLEAKAQDAEKQARSHVNGARQVCCECLRRNVRV